MLASVWVPQASKLSGRNDVLGMSEKNDATHRRTSSSSGSCAHVRSQNLPLETKVPPRPGSGPRSRTSNGPGRISELGTSSGRGTSGIGSWYSSPASGVWNEQRRRDVVLPSCSAVTCRGENNGLARKRSTVSGVGGPGRTGRKKYAWSECGRRRSTVLHAADKDWATT